MIKKELGLRERRRIYEDTICIVAQNQKMAASPAATTRTMKNLMSKQTDKCVSVLATVLGQREMPVETNDEKVIMLVPNDDDKDYIIEKKKFEEIVQQLPNNKELRESLWKAYAKRDKRAKEKLDALIE